MRVRPELRSRLRARSMIRFPTTTFWNLQRYLRTRWGVRNRPMTDQPDPMGRSPDLLRIFETDILFRVACAL